MLPAETQEALEAAHGKAAALAKAQLEGRAEHTDAHLRGGRSASGGNGDAIFCSARRRMGAR